MHSAHENGNDRDWRTFKNKAQNHYLEVVESTEETTVGITEVLFSIVEIGL